MVGQATAHAFNLRGHKCVGYDKKNPDGEKLHEVKEAEVIFICTPEANVQEAFEAVKDSKATLVVRSTVPVGTCKKLGVLHNPEFLRETQAFADSANPQFIILGGQGEALEKLTQLYGAFRRPIFTMTSDESELLKLWSNAKLACNISFGNEMLQIAHKYGANGHMINNILTNNPLYANHPWELGHPYSGRCLPKDMKQLLALYPESVLLRAIEKVNVAL